MAAAFTHPFFLAAAAAASTTREMNSSSSSIDDEHLSSAVTMKRNLSPSPSTSSQTKSNEEISAKKFSPHSNHSATVLSQVNQMNIIAKGKDQTFLLLSLNKMLKFPK